MAMLSFKNKRVNGGLLSTHAPVHSSTVRTNEIAHFLRQFLDSLNTFNKCLREPVEVENGNGPLKGIPVTLSAPTLRDIVRRGGNTEDAEIEAVVRAWKSKKFVGVLPEETIRSVCDAILLFFNNPNLACVVLLGLMQLGKTVNFCTLFLLLPVIIHSLEEKVAVPVITCPDDKNLQTQIKEELTHLYRLFKYIHVTPDAGEEIKEIGTVNVKDYFEECVFPQRQNPYESDSAAVLAMLTMTRNNKWREHFGEIVKLFGKDNFLPIQFVDECQEGTAFEQNLSKWEKDFGPGWASGHADRLVRFWISASPDQGVAAAEQHPDKCMISKQYVPASYTGPHCFANYVLPVIDPKIKPRLPEILSYEEEYPNLAPFLDPKQYATAGRPYQLAFAKAVLQIVRDRITDKHPIFFLRPFSHRNGGIAMCRQLSTDIQKLAGETVKVLDYFGNLDPAYFGDGGRIYGPRKTIKSVLLDNFVRHKRKCLVISCNRSRRGDSYPPQCKHYMDLLSDHLCWNTYVQSTFGRSCGHNKDSVCLFGSEYRDEITDFLDKMSHHTGRQFSKHTEHNIGRRLKDIPDCNYITIYFDQDTPGYRDEPILYTIRQKLNELFNHQFFREGEEGEKRTNYRRIWKRKLRDLFDDQICQQLESIYGHRIVPWGEGITETFRNSIGHEPVYLRWYRSYEEWGSQSNQGGSNIKKPVFADGRLVEPGLIYPLAVVRTKERACPMCGGRCDANMKPRKLPGEKRGKRGPHPDTRKKCCRQLAENEVVLIRLLVDSKPSSGRANLKLKDKAHLQHVFNPMLQQENPNVD